MYWTIQIGESRTSDLVVNLVFQWLRQIDS
jgi:hypothetical protein